MVKYVETINKLRSLENILRKELKLPSLVLMYEEKLDNIFFCKPVTHDFCYRFEYDGILWGRGVRTEKTDIKSISKCLEILTHSVKETLRKLKSGNKCQ